MKVTPVQVRSSPPIISLSETRVLVRARIYNPTEVIRHLCREPARKLDSRERIQTANFVPCGRTETQTMPGARLSASSSSVVPSTGSDSTEACRILRAAAEAHAANSPTKAAKVKGQYVQRSNFNFAQEEQALLQCAGYTGIPERVPHTSSNCLLSPGICQADSSQVTEVTAKSAR
mmetsp:Transcript_56218/g.150135  ORF Transcript_56218/g.150135 Transcript_56218/m.150135 type:complete len:176 (+) Transcript_56218:201-728(+)